MSEVARCRGACVWDSLGLAEIGLGGGGIGIAEERNPILIGAPGFLEVPTVTGVDALVETMFGITR